MWTVGNFDLILLFLSCGVLYSERVQMEWLKKRASSMLENYVPPNVQCLSLPSPRFTQTFTQQHALPVTCVYLWSVPLIMRAPVGITPHIQGCWLAEDMNVRRVFLVGTNMQFIILSAINPTVKELCRKEREIPHDCLKHLIFLKFFYINPCPPHLCSHFKFNSCMRVQLLKSLQWRKDHIPARLWTFSEKFRH